MAGTATAKMPPPNTKGQHHWPPASSPAFTLPPAPALTLPLPLP